MLLPGKQEGKFRELQSLVLPLTRTLVLPVLCGARGQSRRLPAAVTTQPLLSYTWCLLEGGKHFWALTAFFLPWQLSRALRSKHRAHDCVWLVTKQMLQKPFHDDRGSFNFSHRIMWPLAVV